MGPLWRKHVSKRAHEVAAPVGRATRDILPLQQSSRWCEQPKKLR